MRRQEGGAILGIGGRYRGPFTQPVTEILDPVRKAWTPIAVEPAITVTIPNFGTGLTTKQADFPVRFGALLDDGRYLSVAGADPTSTLLRLALAKQLIP